MMLGGGFMYDMMRRLQEDRRASRLRRERSQEFRKRRMNATDHYPMPDTTPEQIDEIIRKTKEKEQQDNRYFIRGALWVIAFVAVGIVLGFLLFT